MKLLKSLACAATFLAANHALACISAIDEAKLFKINFVTSDPIDANTGDYLKVTFYVQGAKALSNEEINKINAGLSKVATAYYMSPIEANNDIYKDMIQVESIKVKQSSDSSDGKAGPGTKYLQNYTLIFSIDRVAGLTTTEGMFKVKLTSPNGEKNLGQAINITQPPLAKCY